MEKTGMTETLRDRLREIEEEKIRWFRERGAQAARLTRDLEIAGGEAWNAATRAGVDLQARTSQELRALGERVIKARTHAASDARPSTGPRSGPQQVSKPPAAILKTATPRQSRHPSTTDGWREASLQADTAIRGAANVLTFGGIDHFAAGMDALLETGGIQELPQRYKANIAEENARNRYDASHRRVAQVTGQVGGTAMGVGLVGPARGAVALAPRLPGAATLSSREAAGFLTAGAATGIGMQAVSDLATGRRSTMGDKAGAILGGVAGAAALPLGPGRAGAVDGWVTSGAQDMFNRRPLSFERAGQGAIAGRALGGMSAKFGTDAVNSLSFQTKGKLGELLGDLRSTANGQRRAWAPKSRDYLPDGSYWYPDARKGSTRFEDKFGYDAELSPNQARAQSVLGPNFKLYHFTPDDIGRLLSIPSSAIAPQMIDDLTRRY
jgi:hypothetical protein